MAVNKTAKPWPDECLSDLDHDSWIIKLIKPEYFSLDNHILWIYGEIVLNKTLSVACIIS